MRKTSTDIRVNNGWHKSFVERIEGKQALLSVVFSWDVGKATVRACELICQGYSVSIGGPAARYAGICCGDGVSEAIHWHNPDACMTSTGCVNDCPFCIVAKTEGDLREKDSWIPRPIVCDNNLTACSRRHFDKVIDSLKQLKQVDINQGLSAQLMTPHHADRLRELDMKYVRLAWDNVNYEQHFMRGWDILRRAGFPRSMISVYVLIGFHDTPDDALYRLETTRRLGGVPFPMRYQPLGAPKRNCHVGEHWTHKELVRFCRYWVNLRITSRIPFSEFEYRGAEDSVA